MVALMIGNPLSSNAQAPLAHSPEDTALEEEMKFLKEENVSIAIRHEQPISQAPSNVYVITDEDIRHSGAIDIPTILRRIPGMEVMQMTGAEFNVSARGDNQQNANKMLVLVDGRSVYFDLQGGYFWKAIPVTLPEIKRIEVLKGPASALYGFNAFDGVVNIITKSPEEMKGTTLQFGGGEFGTITSSAVHAGRQGKLGYRLSLGRDQNQQWRNRDALAFRDHKFNIQTEYALTEESRLLISGGFVDVNRFDGPNIETTTASTPFTDKYARAEYARRNFFIRGFWRELRFDANNLTNPLLASFGPGGISSIRVHDRSDNSIRAAIGNTYDIEAQHTLEFGARDRFSYGVNYRHNTLSDNFTDEFSREDRLGLYLQNEWKPINSLTFVAGFRYDLHTEINATFSPRVALLYAPADNHTFRAAMSVAYRPPTLNETHLDIRSTPTLFGVPCPVFVPGPCPIPIKGNSRLGPEQIISYELGYQGWFFRHRLRARADLFFNHIEDLIKSAGAVFSNDPGFADIYGGEAGIEFLATSWLTGFANYSYQEISQTFTGDARRGGPMYKFNVGLRAEWMNGLNGEAWLHHYGAVTYPLTSAFADFAPLGVIPPNPTVGSYTLLNLRLGYLFWKDKAEVAVSAFNALNDRHNEHPLGDIIASRVMGWITLRL